MHEATRAELAHKLAAIVGAPYVLIRPEELLLYEYDGSALDQALPGLVVLPSDTGELAACLREAARLGVDVVPRGAGTGLAGGSVPVGGGLVVATTRMNRVLVVDPAARMAVVQPGVVNLDVSASAARYGLHFAPDPSSQRVSTVGGNVATNAGGPHCLKYGVTATHVLALTLVLSDGQVLELGKCGADAPGYDLLSVVIGSEGTFGVVSEITVRLIPEAETAHTILAIFDQIEHAGAAVSAIIAAGIVPAALEMIVGEGIRAIEASVQAGYPTDAQAVLLIELDGLREELANQSRQIEAICGDHGVRELQSADEPQRRARLWAGRKGALAACARIAPHYHIQDVTVPRSRLPEVLALTDEIAHRHGIMMVNIFHAGDGNLHPLLLFDLHEPGVRERAIAAGDEIMRACVEVGGTVSGEHGIGIEKRDALTLLFSRDDLRAFGELRAVFDPTGRMNPGKLLPDQTAFAELRRTIG